MIASVEEFLDAKRTLMMEVEREKRRGALLPTSIKVGTMIEVPSLIFQLDRLLQEVDFISIGTNDLAQFLYATDRGNPLIWNRYDPLAPPLLKALKYICDACQKANVPCSVCGEMAGRSLEAIALVGLGFRSLSMNPAALGAVKAAIRTMDQAQVGSYLEKQLQTSTRSLRETLKMYAQDHGILI
jgi:phosphotransferase system enzyme I (PtsP)